jgi:hypothetical protein
MILIFEKQFQSAAAVSLLNILQTSHVIGFYGKTAAKPSLSQLRMPGMRRLNACVR